VVGSFVQLRLTTDHQICQLSVCSCPGFEDLWGECGAKDFLHRGQEILADDFILLRTDKERNMFLADALKCGLQRVEIVDIRRIGVECRRQCLRLAAVGLVGLVKDAAEFRDLAELVLVEDVGDAAAVCFEDGHGGYDDCGLLVRQRHCDVKLFLCVIVPMQCLLYFGS
jgi:hypothetical protein